MIKLIPKLSVWSQTKAVPSGPGGRLNIKMSSYQYRDPHVKDETGIPIPGKDGLYIETGPRYLWQAGMKTSWHKNTFLITGPLWRESIGNVHIDEAFESNMPVYLH